MLYFVFTLLILILITNLKEEAIDLLMFNNNKKLHLYHGQRGNMIVYIHTLPIISLYM
jgi:hypothetical protein